MLFQYYTLFICTLFILSIGGFLFFLIRGDIEISRVYRNVPQDVAPEESADELAAQHVQYTPLELERMAEMARFDARISSLKDEVSRTVFPGSKLRESPVVPDESEGVINLAHNTVHLGKAVYRDEVAE